MLGDDIVVRLVDYAVAAFGVAAFVVVVFAGILLAPRIGPRRFGVERDLGLGESEMGRRMDVGGGRRPV